MAAGDHGALETLRLESKRPRSSNLIFCPVAVTFRGFEDKDRSSEEFGLTVLVKSGPFSSSHDIRYGMALHQPYAERLAAVHSPPWLRV
ncbi:hypothetical protein CGRA01v4_13312 [Colletotrichum graminicola]|nr:hypothetical protein CGRA01v4_13312 [Colletotrichum graminicola]